MNALAGQIAKENALISHCIRENNIPLPAAEPLYQVVVHGAPKLLYIILLSRHEHSFVTTKTDGSQAELIVEAHSVLDSGVFQILIDQRMTENS